jgi:hypothetical protein
VSKLGKYPICCAAARVAKRVDKVCILLLVYVNQ